MKIATYNLRLGGQKQGHTQWQQLLEEKPDICLIQETFDPKKYLDSERYELLQDKILWQPIEGEKWGSALLVSSGTVVPIDVPGLQGWVTGAEVKDFSWYGNEPRRLRVFSLHAPKPYKQPIRKLLDWVQATFTDDYDLVIGGDFNLTVGIRHATEELKEDEYWILTAMQKELGLMSCWQMANPNQNLPQTLRWASDPTPNKSKSYHCDGIFVPARWYQWLDASAVLNSEQWKGLSDHYPVIAKFSKH